MQNTAQKKRETFLICVCTGSLGSLIRSHIHGTMCKKALDVLSGRFCNFLEKFPLFSLLLAVTSSYNGYNSISPNEA